jgi:hypothetical protein
MVPKTTAKTIVKMVLLEAPEDEAGSLAAGSVGAVDGSPAISEVTVEV